VYGLPSKLTQTIKKIGQKNGSSGENGQLGLGVVIASWNIKRNFSVIAGV
jgi:hypothetical protein